LAAHWTAAGLQIDRIHLQRDDLQVDVSGLLQPVGDWPLSIQGQVQLPPQGEQSWTLALDIQGDLRKTLQLQGQSSGYLDALLSAELQPLAEQLPARLNITSEAFKASADLPDTLTLEKL
ncbi:hypothetical protein, partial [Pandoraea sputorum]